MFPVSVLSDVGGFQVDGMKSCRVLQRKQGGRSRAKKKNITGRLVGYCSARLALKGDVQGDVCDSSAAAELSSL